MRLLKPFPQTDHSHREHQGGDFEDDGRLVSGGEDRSGLADPEGTTDRRRDSACTRSDH